MRNTEEQQPKKKVLVTGSNGQVGICLQSLLSENSKYICTFWNSQAHDLTKHECVTEALTSLKPNIIINAAAYTQVDLAEKEREKAFAVNGQAVKHLAEVAADLGARFIHISTDYVFSEETPAGKEPKPKQTDDQPNPINYYGASKLAGEQAIAEIPSLDWVCIRTAWVYSNWRTNFLNTMLRLMVAAKPIRVVNDQIGSPTSAHSLARAILTCMENPSISGMHHWTDEGTISWYDFAAHIQTLALKAGLLTKEVEISPIPTEAYPTPAKRPKLSLLCKQKTAQALKIAPTPWQIALQHVLSVRNKELGMQDQQQSGNTTHQVCHS